MSIDTGLAVVIIAVLIFYLRLITLQRERAKRLAQAPLSANQQTKKQKSSAHLQQRYSILSTRRSDLAIAALGIVAILAGILLYMSVLPLSPIQPYWWLPTAAGIVAFSWAFKL